jgi:hypothetical protein
MNVNLNIMTIARFARNVMGPVKNARVNILCMNHVLIAMAHAKPAKTNIDMNSIVKTNDMSYALNAKRVMIVEKK